MREEQISAGVAAGTLQLLYSSTLNVVDVRVNFGAEKCQKSISIIILRTREGVSKVGALSEQACRNETMKPVMTRNLLLAMIATEKCLLSSCDHYFNHSITDSN